MKIIVIGGGIIGASVAWRLAAERHQVTVLERAQLGQEASWAAAGMISPQVEADGPGPFLDFCVAGRNAYQEIAERLIRESGVDPEYDDDGVLYVGVDEAERAEVNRRAEWQSRAGLKLEVLSGAQARALEPALSPAVSAALYFPSERPLENRKLTQAYIAAAHKSGARFEEGVAVDELIVGGGRLKGVRTHDGTSRECDVVVNAAGAWGSQIRGLEADRIRLRPVRGQMLCFNARPGAVRHGLFSPRGYLVPRRDGRIIAGSTFEEAGFNKSVTVAGMEKIAGSTRALVPELEAMPFREAWAGLRPAASDQMPVIGPSPTIGGLYYAIGHFRSGILLSAITGELIAGLVAGRKIEIDLKPFSAARFLI